MFKKDGFGHYRYRQLKTRFDFDWIKFRWCRNYSINDILESINDILY